MRSTELTYNGEKIEAVLVAGGAGFKIYSSLAIPGWLIAVKRKVVLVSETDDQFKLVSKYVTLKYQPSEVQSQITSDFNSYIGTIMPAEKKAPSRDSVVEPIL